MDVLYYACIRWGLGFIIIIHHKIVRQQLSVEILIPTTKSIIGYCVTNDNEPHLFEFFVVIFKHMTIMDKILSEQNLKTTEYELI